MEDLIQELEQDGILKTPLIREAFLAIDRSDFVPDEMKGFAYVNEALPIGYDQTISQPGVVAFMLEQLQPQAGETILDIGAGSGWTTALLSHIVGEQGKVVGIELISELATTAKANLELYSFIKKGLVELIQGNGAAGYSPRAPYDKILVSASLPTKEIPEPLKEQLKIDGTMLIPIKESIWKLTKTSEEEFHAAEHPGFLFVPFKRNLSDD